MASPGDDNAELGTASAGGTSVSQVEPEVVNNSVYQPLDGSQNHQREKLQVLGAIQILNGATILALGVFLGSLQSIFHSFRHFFFTFYTGYPLWGALFFIVPGSLSVAAGKKPTRMLVQNNFGMSFASATIAIVGLVFLAIQLAVNKHSLKECQSSQSLDLCICLGILSNGLMSLMLILTLLGLFISLSVIALWCSENSRNRREQIVIIKTAELPDEGHCLSQGLVNGLAPEIELSEVSLRDNTLREKTAPAPPCHTWLMLLRRELQFLGVTQILIAVICLCFGIMVFSVISFSKFEDHVFSSFKAGYPFWGAAFFAISGFLPIMSEKKHAIYLVWGSLGANTVSSIAAGIGIFILTINLKTSWVYFCSCWETQGDDFCFVACFSTEVVAMILFLTILGFCSAVSLIIYGVGEVFQGKKIPEDRLYEELNIYSPIYSELESKGEMSSPADS